MNVRFSIAAVAISALFMMSAAVEATAQTNGKSQDGTPEPTTSGPDQSSAEKPKPCKDLDPAPDPKGGCKPSGLRKRQQCSGQIKWGQCK